MNRDNIRKKIDEKIDYIIRYWRKIEIKNFREKGVYGFF